MSRAIEEWLQLDYVPDPTKPEAFFVMAYVSNPDGDHVFTVELHPENIPRNEEAGPLMAQVRRELDFFLSDLREKDPMKYLRYRATTASNAMSELQWQHCVVKAGKST